ncbi:glycogen synthase GlgA [Helicovermis profundi]|uniref:Glycogen synthase n=1 Tax=Helicovermis profundi TaxID=3065157 RepID=A0AAU9ECJ9_9FIRM|nr:glycogen synthase GlgA [Clostridia bacterium S502]
MKVLFVSAEVVPFSKTGGLADVAYALPKALRDKGIDVRIMSAKNFHSKNIDYYEDHIVSKDVEVGWRKQYLGITYVEYDKMPFYFIDNEYYFKRDNLYGYEDDGERYSYFCRAILEAISVIDFKPDIIHINDWHTAMVPLLMKKHYSHIDKFKNIKIVYTIHNLKYQGVFNSEVLHELLNLDDEEFNSGSIEFFGNVNFMKSAINFADAVTTVSKSYAEEIKNSYYGENLQDVIRENDYKLFGITNGIDYKIYDPNIDKNIRKNYSYKNSSYKSENKQYLQELVALPKHKTIPLIAMITRLTDQKGLDLLECIMEELLTLDIQMIILGTGDSKYENILKEFAYRFPDKLAVKIEFNESFSHQIYAGADMFLMPSKFEPCGLSQMISQRYGTVPIVRETGGLKDTVAPYNKFTKEGTGFSFESYNAHEMLFSIKRAIEIYSNKKEWRDLVKIIMQIDSSWKKSASIYASVYEDLVK